MIISFSCRKKKIHEEDRCLQIDNVLYGKIGGQDFRFSIGVFEESQTSDNHLQLYLYGPVVLEENACDPFSTIGNNYVKASIITQTGVFYFGDVSSSDYRFSLVDYSGNIVVNTVLSTGTLEINSITENRIEGKICAEEDANNFIVGSFNLKKCE